MKTWQQAQDEKAHELYDSLNELHKETVYRFMELLKRQESPLKIAMQSRD